MRRSIREQKQAFVCHGHTMTFSCIQIHCVHVLYPKLLNVIFILITHTVQLISVTCPAASTCFITLCVYYVLYIKFTKLIRLILTNVDCIFMDIFFYLGRLYLT